MIFSLQLVCQSKIGFFKAVSDSSDNATISLTQDLYFQKLSLISTVAVTDFRDVKFDISKIDEYSNLDYTFYTEIQENGSGWKCSFYAFDVKTKQKYSSQTDYESYYMILMGAKNEISNFIDRLKKSSLENTQSTNNILNSNVANTISIESLSGTWSGEDFIDKIVILRGGRGFVIYDNGASMNISIKIEDGNLIATQTSKANASYFPEISREKALELAPTAEPIEWKFNIKNSHELEGTKYTLTEKDSNPSYSHISVKWKKQ